MHDELDIGNDDITVRIAPVAGGRVAQITIRGVDLLVGRDSRPDTSGALAWGSYPMVPWAGRVRDGRFEFRGRRHQLPLTLGGHAIHGVGFVSVWDVVHHDATSVELALDLPTDARWPFGGTARQRIGVDGDVLSMTLGAAATDQAFPVSIGWHPWFRKPDRLDFHPSAMYRRDARHVTVDELVEVPPGPWDDCFVNDRPVGIVVDGLAVTLSSGCSTWVVYDQPAHATCIEPQTAPPDAFNIAPHVLDPGESVSARYEIAAAAPAEAHTVTEG